MWFPWLRQWAEKYALSFDLRSFTRGRRRANRSRAGPALMVERVEDRCLLNAGALDPSFGTDGKVITGFIGSLNDVASAIVRQPDGKIVVAGGSNGDFALARYNADGTLDPSFGTDGKVTTDDGKVNTDFVIGAFNGASAVALQPDGKIVLAGTFSDLVAGSAVARYNADGSLDTTFGTGGTVTTNFRGKAIALHPDGKIMVAGPVNIFFGDPPFGISSSDFALARYNADGSPDTSFDTDGIVTTDFSTTEFDSSDDATAVALQPDGKIVLAGTSNGAFTLARYNADGSLDSTFDTDGRVTASISGSISAAALQPDGKIVVAGTGGSGFALARYNGDGSLDSTFDSDGSVTTDFGGGFASAVAVQPDGKIVVAGTTGSDLAVARYNGGGSLDSTFDSDGTVTTDFGLGGEEAKAVVVQPDGKIVVAGTAGSDFALARYNGDGSLDSTFGTGGMVATTFLGPGTATARGVAIQPDGKTVVVGSFNATSGDFFALGDFAVARYNADGSLDPFFGTDGKVSTDFGRGSDGASAVALQPDGKIVVAGFSASDFAVARYNADGSLDPSFGTGGRVTAEVGGVASAVALQPDSRILVAGTSNGDFAVARYNGDGSLDSTFGSDGTVTTDFSTTESASGSSDGASAVALQPDGKIVLVGATSIDFHTRRFAVARYNADGSLDTAFDNDGKVTTDFLAEPVFFPFSAEASAVALQPDGKIVVAGSVIPDGLLAGLPTIPPSDFAVARYNADGSPDTSFDSDGAIFPILGIGLFRASAVVLQPDGKIVVAGSVGTDAAFGGPSLAIPTSDFVLARYNGDGSPDTSFDTDGRVITRFASGSVDSAGAVAVQTDGKIVVAGTSGSDFAVARYLSLDELPFGAAAFSVPEEAGTAILAVSGTGDSGLTTTFQVGTMNGTASADSDYTPPPATVTFAPGQTTQTITIPILQDSLVEPRETFIVTVSGPIGDVPPARITQTVVAISSDDGTANQRFVAQAYQNLLLRPPEEGGLAFWSGHLDRGVPQAIIAAALSHSAEYYDTSVIRPAYRQFLGREADEAGVNFWVQQLLAGLTSEQVQVALLASSEYYDNAARSDGLFVQAVYNDLISRLPSFEEQNSLADALATAVTREQVAFGITASPERVGIAVRGMYQGYLGRLATENEVAFWVDAFRRGASNEDIVTGFIGSAEYFQQATR